MNDGRVVADPDLLADLTDELAATARELREVAAQTVERSRRLCAEAERLLATHRAGRVTRRATPPPRGELESERNQLGHE